MRVLPCGQDSLLVEVDDLMAAVALAAALRPLCGARPAGGAGSPRAGAPRTPPLLDVVAGAVTVLVRAAPGVSLAQVRSLVQAARPQAATPADAAAVRIPVRYDGADLAEVARLTGLSEREVVDAHTGIDWTVAFGGFAPGFAYLTGSDQRLAVPRRTASRTRVPAGSVGLAGEFSGVYPRESPGGWQLIGRTDITLWDVDADPPALLRPGVTVRFVEQREPALSAPHRSKPHREPHPSEPADAVPEQPASAGTRALVVQQTGVLSTIQDLGRPGYADLGVGRSGAADAGAIRLANRLVGNPESAAAIEVTAGGLALRAERPVQIAGAGAPAALVVDDVQHWTGEALHLLRGQSVTVRAPVAGLRTYLAVRGGIDVAPVLGSRSTDLLSGVGSARLHPGRSLPVGPEPTRPVPPADVVAGPAYQPVMALRIWLGPRDDWFAATALRALTSTIWTVTPRSDRVGLRLTGSDLPRTPACADAELPSEGVVEGAIQVPPTSEPVLFLADHPVTGGYPVIAVVDSADVARAAQLRPGDPVRFTISS